MTASASQKVVLITGCSGSGIGYHLAQAFRSHGCRVFVSARNLTKLSPDLDEGFDKVTLDVMDEGSIQKAVAEVESKTSGKIDILINNAGQGCVGPLAEVPISKVAQTYETNVFGLLRVTQAVTRGMILNRSGLVINISSIVSFVPTPWAGVYCSTKAAVTSLSDVLRMELGGFNIKVLCVFPGAIRSGIGSANAAAFEQPSDSNYANVKGRVLQRATWSQCPQSTNAADLAEEIATAALKAGPPAYLAAGHRAWRAWWSYYLPYWAKDWFWGRQFGIDEVGGKATR